MNWKTISGNFAKYANLDELVFDITLALFAIFFRRIVVPEGKTIVGILTPVSALVLTLMIDFTVSLLVGGLYLRYEKTIEKHPAVKKIILPVIFITVLFLFLGIPAVMHEQGLLPLEWMIIPFIAGLFLILAGGSFGFSKDKKQGCITGAILFAIPGLFGLIYALLYFGVDMGNWFAGIGIMIGGIIAFAGILVLLTKIAEKLFDHETGGYTLPGTVLFGFLLPFLIAVSLGFWQEIIAVNQVKTAEGGKEFIQTIVTLIMYGIIPVRIMMALAPPYRIINTGVGLASLTVYIFTLQSYINSLIGAVK
ncbi:MAG: hypothetical protein A2014_05160 [Spirochaetes bacterium GWF1_49_6]|nr:MAG: hypothetical protein A2014_05160 [Spirochaetes bacterium GWF1_49_6]